MQKFEMNIEEKYLQHIKKNIKSREYRLNNTKRKLIKVDDIITLTSVQRPEHHIDVVVTSIELFLDWRAALEKYWQQDFQDMYESMEAALLDCEKFYTAEDVAKHGIVVFGIKQVELSLSDILIFTRTPQF